MSDQLGLFDVAVGRALRDAAIERVEDPPWRSFADRALAAVMARQDRVTSDDVWAELDRMGIPRPIEGRAMGPVMQSAVRDGQLRTEGFTQGTQPKHHADIMRVYAVVRRGAA